MGGGRQLNDRDHLASMKGLQSLSLSWAQELTPRTLRTIAEGLHELRNLRLLFVQHPLNSLRELLQLLAPRRLRFIDVSGYLPGKLSP